MWIEESSRPCRACVDSQRAIPPVPLTLIRQRDFAVDKRSLSASGREAYVPIDILESVDQTIRESHPDFELYRRLKESGRSALQDGTFEGGCHQKTKITLDGVEPSFDSTEV